jgi:hypothetical protein
MKLINWPLHLKAKLIGLGLRATRGADPVGTNLSAVAKDHVTDIRIAT